MPGPSAGHELMRRLASHAQRLLRDRPKYGSLLSNAVVPDQSSSQLPSTKRVLVEYPRKLHRQEGRMIFSAKGNSSSISISRQARRHPALAILITSQSYIKRGDTQSLHLLVLNSLFLTLRFLLELLVG
ncbi:hypothetical protein PIB30_082686 [Stylosanthes scabra]|uniref:Uncharacterized protein n=1 Tax=Stylosanthes scabra TaxID=79078 RepID=A0ABU6ZQN5_9FABA|nr:hypothetical protein [Stylosanthes scabra]